MQEIQKAQDVINKIKDMKQGLIGTALVTVLNEVQHFSLVWCLVLWLKEQCALGLLLQISSEVAKLPQSRLLPRSPGHEDPLRIDMPKFQPASSSEWLAKHGLKGANLHFKIISKFSGLGNWTEEWRCFHWEFLCFQLVTWICTKCWRPTRTHSKKNSFRSSEKLCSLRFMRSVWWNSSCRPANHSIHHSLRLDSWVALLRCCAYITQKLPVFIFCRRPWRSFPGTTAQWGTCTSTWLSCSNTRSSSGRWSVCMKSELTGSHPLPEKSWALSRRRSKICVSSVSICFLLLTICPQVNVQFLTRSSDGVLCCVRLFSSFWKQCFWSRPIFSRWCHLRLSPPKVPANHARDVPSTQRSPCSYSVVIVIDMSVSNANYLVHIQHSLRQLLEQQLANKDYFNLIV